MAHLDRLTVLNMMIESGMIPVFYNPDAETAIQVALACVAGGAPVIEFTNRGDFAPAVFHDLCRALRKQAPRVALGVGSIVDAPTASLYLAHGADFVVGPNLNPEVARLCNRRKIAYSPGCGSASEIAQAEELGVEIVKIFPGGSVGGPAFVKAILGPCPWTRIMPTGGVDATQESLTPWFRAGAACVGMGSNLITRELVDKGDFAALSRRTAQIYGWIRQIRGQGIFAGVEHVGIYPRQAGDAAPIAQWYERLFGLKIHDGNSSIFAEGPGLGRIEIMKQTSPAPCHIAIRVNDFEAAVASLQAQGVELEDPKIKAEVKAVFLKQPDPAGNRVHLLWRCPGSA